MGTFHILVFVLCIGNFAFGDKYRNYCQDPDVQKLCSGKKHVACTYLARDWGRTCKAYKMFNLTDQLKKMIVHHHNWYREKVATGNGRSKHGTFPQAADMLYVDWDNELAYLASLNVKQCEMKHDECRAVDDTSGQNLGYVATSHGTTVKEVIAKVIRGWYKEIKDAKPDNARNYTGQGVNNKVINHFGALAWGNTHRIGCAMSRYNKTYDNLGTRPLVLQTYLFACNYAPAGNWLYQSMYKVGTPCSKCPSKVCKSKYKLCKTIYKNAKKTTTPTKPTKKPSKPTKPAKRPKPSNRQYRQ